MSDNIFKLDNRVYKNKLRAVEKIKIHGQLISEMSENDLKVAIVMLLNFTDKVKEVIDKEVKYFTELDFS